MDRAILHKTIYRVVQAMVEGKYEELESARVQATDIRRVVEAYGRCLSMPPVDAFGSLLNVIEITGTQPSQWYAGVNLWTLEDGWSDLTLELTLTDSAGELYPVQVDDLRVL